MKRRTLLLRIVAGILCIENIADGFLTWHQYGVASLHFGIAFLFLMFAAGVE